MLLGNGDGTFRAPVNYSVLEAKPDSVAVRRLSMATARTDPVVASQSITTLLRLDKRSSVRCSWATATGRFKIAVSYRAGATPSSVAVGDFNGDGRGRPRRLLTTDGDNVSVLLGNGDGTFQGTGELRRPGEARAIDCKWETSMETAKADLAVANYSG